MSWYVVDFLGDGLFCDVFGVWVLFVEGVDVYMVDFV